MLQPLDSVIQQREIDVDNMSSVDIYETIKLCLIEKQLLNDVADTGILMLLTRLWHHSRQLPLHVTAQQSRRYADWRVIITLQS